MGRELWSQRNESPTAAVGHREVHFAECSCVILCSWGRGRGWRRALNVGECGETPKICLSPTRCICGIQGLGTRSSEAAPLALSLHLLPSGDPQGPVGIDQVGLRPHVPGHLPHLM